MSKLRLLKQMQSSVCVFSVRVILETLLFEFRTQVVRWMRFSLLGFSLNCFNYLVIFICLVVADYSTSYNFVLLDSQVVIVLITSPS